MPTAKIVIVGAGPAGAACALSLARQGTAEVLLMDKSTYPRVKVCGSGLSPYCLEVLDRLGVKQRFAARAVHVPNMIARGPKGQEVFLSGQKGAWVVPRVEFDQGLVSEAIAAGARFQEDTKVTDVLRTPSGDVRGVKTAAGEIEADLVICANGSPSRFSRDESPAYGIRTLMGWWRGGTLPAGQGVMIWDRRLDGYYTWAFPEPDGVVNIGLTIPEGAADAKRLKDLLTELLEEHFGTWIRHADQVGKWMGHPAVVSTRIHEEIAETRALWIGEAARLVSPATVEGISFAMESGMMAAAAVNKHFTAAHGLSRVGRGIYRTRTRARMLPKFWAGEAFVKLMRSERARSWSSKVFNPQWIASKATTLVGERPTD